MNKSFPNTLQLFIIYLSIWIIFSIVRIFLLFHYLPDNGLYRDTILFDTIVCNTLQAGCILSLWYPVKFYRNTLNLPLFFLFHVLLFLISSTVWIGAGYLIIRILLPDYTNYPDFFLTLLPIRFVFGVLTYVIFILAYYFLFKIDELKKQKQTIEAKKNESIPAPAEKLSRIIVKKNSEYHCITVNQIRYIEANGDYVLIYTDSNRYLKDQPMKYWETHLPSDYFVRIHRSFIVNIEMIAKIELYEKETYKVHLKTGDILKSSNAGYKLLKQKMLM